MAAYCWGSIINGPLGGVEEELLLYPREIDWSESAKVIKVSCGTSHTLFLTNDGKTYSCGNNDWGQLGHDLLPRKRPRMLPF
uniref:Uncharacterized protein n=1 Tax=Megaselia scalaris TaxID=36166 RepID=T1GQS8_MEGSC